jgi:dTDP-4-dehydrorhamnose reductase
MPDHVKILVTGANGQLGKELKELSSSFPEFDFIFLSRTDLPIHHYEMVRDYFKVYKPSFFINCAAYTAVDRAEQEKDLAMQVNGESVGVLAAICKENDCRFIHVSTDYVFDGNATEPYTEDSPTNPQSAYGASKLEGEKQALQFNSDTIIIRTSWVYSEFGKNFVKTMMKLMSEKKEISVVNDQTGSPTYALDLAEAILTIVANSSAQSKNWKPGIYHYSNSGVISWYEFAVAIKEITGVDCVIHPIPTSSYPTPAKRPVYSVLNTKKIQQEFGIVIPEWKQSLAKCMPKVKADS